jgi:lipopolysaccharide transport system permease protein
MISGIILLALMAWHDFCTQLAYLDITVVYFDWFCSCNGRGLWLSALNVKYRDFRYIVPFILQFGLYISPVGFSSSIVPERWRLLYSLNPMVGVIDGFRWAILGGEAKFYWPGFTLSVGLVALLLYWYLVLPQDGTLVCRRDLSYVGYSNSSRKPG